MCKRWRIALPLHPEYRTLPMVWYVPPLSPVETLGEQTVAAGGDADSVFVAIEQMRIPTDYLASFLSAGDPEPVRTSLRRMTAMRRYKRAIEVDGEPRPEIAREVGMEPRELEEMFRMVAIADYDQRYVVPPRHGEMSPAAFAEQGTRGIDFTGSGVVPMPEMEPDPAAADGFDLRESLIRVEPGDKR